jgi:hypothetical protein
MRRLFPILAAVTWFLLLASFVSGLLAPGEGRPSLGLIAFLATIGIYALVAIYLRVTGKQVEKAARLLGLPDWVQVQAEKNRRKAFAYEKWGLALIIPAAWADTLPGDRPWSCGMLAFNLSFQLGAFVGGYVIIMAQSRLLQDLESWAGSNGPAGEP